MSLKGIIEFIIRVESYYIIEYPQQGLFSFHITVYQTQGKKRTYALPYQIIANPRKPEQKSTRIFEQPYIDDEIFVTSTGLAKYSQEEIELDDWARLRLQIQGYPELYCEDIYLQIQFRLNDKYIKDPQREGELMEVNTFKLNDIQNGLFNFCECNMKAPYSSRLKFYVMGFITTFKFEKYQPLDQQLSNFQKKRLRAGKVDDLITIAKLQYPNQNIQELFYTNYVKKLRIGQYLIAQKFNSLRKKKKDAIIKVNQEFVSINNYQVIKQKQFKQYLDKFFPKNLIISTIFKQINQIRQENFIFIQSILKEWMEKRINQSQCKKQYQIFQKQHYGERVFKSIIQGKEQIEMKKQLSSKENKKIAKEIRGKNISLNNYAIQNIKYEQQKEKQSIVFYEIIFPIVNQAERQLLSIPQPEKKIAIEGRKLQYSQKHMLVVLCHGFQGSSYDMYLIKRWIMKQIPDAYFLIAKSNEDNTEGDIRVMGKKVAEEIENYIKNYMEEYQQQNVVINLVGHSMGGIIARAALPHLEKYKHQFGFFCSLSSPHLGYLNGVSGLIKVGLWAIRRWKKIQSLQQLSMQQRGDPRKTYLYELSKTGHLRYFRKVILVSSYEDSYVSWNSARISSHRSKNSHAKVEEEMQNNILGNNIFGATIHRLDINFNVKTSDLDSFIGRTAHINLIISENLFKILGITIPNLFNLIEYGREGLFL